MVNGTKTERLQMLADSGWLRRVDDYRFANRIPTRAKAIRQLVEKGLEASRNERRLAFANEPA